MDYPTLHMVAGHLSLADTIAWLIHEGRGKGAQPLYFFDVPARDIITSRGFYEKERHALCREGNLGAEDFQKYIIDSNAVITYISTQPIVGIYPLAVDEDKLEAHYIS